MKSVIIPVFKKGSLKDCKDYRAIQDTKFMQSYSRIKCVNIIKLLWEKNRAVSARDDPVVMNISQ
jgi:hypothetical protein